MTDEWIDRIEDYLKATVSASGQPEELTENPKYRYRQADKIWYRRCHRCDFKQDAVEGIGFEPTSHICTRDSTIKFVLWS